LEATLETVKRANAQNLVRRFAFAPHNQTGRCNNASLAPAFDGRAIRRSIPARPILARLYTNGILGAPVSADLPSPSRSTVVTMTSDPIRLTVNGESHVIAATADTPLLYILRNDLELNGPKYGCGLGECGACTVIVDGVAARSCVLPLSACAGRSITTLEGLGSRERPDPLQAAFVQHQAAQCGYCLNGMIMTAKALLLRNPHPSEQEIKQALRYNLCRCGTHVEILAAVMTAAGHHVARDHAAGGAADATH
jgi:nicotinate dehydrogenase subunit A